MIRIIIFLLAFLPILSVSATIPSLSVTRNVAVGFQFIDAESDAMISDLDAGIPKFFQSRDLRHIRDIRNNYESLADQKSAYLELKKALLQRQKQHTGAQNKIINDYYTGLIREIDSQTRNIDQQIAAEQDTQKSLFKKILEIFE